MNTAKPDGLVISNKTHCTATLSWSPVSDETSYEVRYRKNTEPYGVPLNAGFDTLYQFTGLLPSVKYDLQVRAKCESTGEKSPWVKKSVTTAACGLVINPVATTSSTSATINWIDPCGTNNYKIRYREEGVANWIKKGISSNIVDLVNLQPATIYEYQIKTICPNASSSYTQISNFTTGPMRGEAFKTSDEGGMLIYPNPASSLISIKFKGFSSSLVHLSVINILNQTVKDELIILDNKHSIIGLSIIELEEGIYFLKADRDGETFTKAFTVLRNY